MDDHGAMTWIAAIAVLVSTWADVRSTEAAMAVVRVNADGTVSHAIDWRWSIYRYLGRHWVVARWAVGIGAAVAVPFAGTVGAAVGLAWAAVVFVVSVLNWRNARILESGASAPATDRQPGTTGRGRVAVSHDGRSDLGGGDGGH